MRGRNDRGHRTRASWTSSIVDADGDEGPSTARDTMATDGADGSVVEPITDARVTEDVHARGHGRISTDFQANGALIVIGHLYERLTCAESVFGLQTLKKRVWKKQILAKLDLK